jgi:hypothetical protein
MQTLIDGCIWETPRKTNESLAVRSTYTALRLIEGWEVMASEDKLFYEIEGKPDCAYATLVLREKRFSLSCVQNL